MAERAGATITVAEGASHVPMMSQPQLVADVILTAVAAAAQKKAEA
jgi:pimeloyl-ACP methyl ester carboxylesterase